MKKNGFKNLIGILIAIGYFLISVFLGSLLNVIVLYACGADSLSDMAMTDNYAGYILILITGIAIHILFGWLTAKRLVRYGTKKDANIDKLLRAAYIAVYVAAFIILPALLGSKTGWLIYAVHALCVTMFGRRERKKLTIDGDDSFISDPEESVNDLQTEVSNHITPSLTSNPVFVSESKPTEADPDPQFCRFCGSKVVPGSRYCSRCGREVEK